MCAASAISSAPNCSTASPADDDLDLLITISGLPGAGTSTVARLVAESLQLERLDGGTVFRAMAAGHGLDVTAFSLMAESDAEIDLELDQRLANRAKAGDVVLESRLAGWIAINERLPATKVWIEARAEERARRVAEREGIGLPEALRANEARERSERTRYRTYYAIELDDLDIYDLIVDSTSATPEELTKSILGALSP